jgi:hypothetical protein
MRIIILLAAAVLSMDLRCRRQMRIGRKTSFYMT